MNGRILYKDICDQIVKDILLGNYTIGQSIPSHSELCKKYNVSLVTIKKALERAEELGYINRCRGKKANVSLNAIENSNRRNKIMLLDVITEEHREFQANLPEPKIFPPICDEWHSQIKKGILSSLSDDYSLLSATYHYKDIIEGYEDTLIPEVDKIVIIIGSSPSLVAFLQSKGKKVVAFDTDDSVKCCRVVNNELSVCRLAMDYLIMLGHKRIAFLGVTAQSGVFYSRYKAYRDALMEANLPINGNLLRLSKYSTADMGYKAMLSIIYSPEVSTLPTAIFCADDFMAYGALIAMKQCKINCPNDISIIGVNNYKEICEYTDPQLSSIEKNYRLIGETISKIINREKWVNDLNVVDCSLVIRNSIKKIN